MKIVALVGSLRKDSCNMQLVKTIKERYSTLFDLEIAEIGILPYYNEDNEIAPPREVEQFKKLICKSGCSTYKYTRIQLVDSGCFKKCVGVVI